MYEGEDVNTIDLLYENDTDQKNGVKIIIPINYYDRTEFVKKMKEQLCYFENVYFDCSGIPNQFNIFRGKYFQYSDLCQDDRLHICLDNVYYPIDFAKLGIPVINSKIGIRLSLTDGVFPTPNRESLRYTKESKEVILSKIKEIANVFVTDYNKTISETDSFKDLYQYFENSTKYVSYDFGSININPFVNFSDIKLESIKFKHSGKIDTKVLYYALKKTYNEFYNIRFYYDGGRVYDCSKGSYKHQFSFSGIIDNSKVVYTYSDSIKGIQKDYIRWTNKVAIVLKKKIKPLKLFKSRSTILDDLSIYHLLKLDGVPREEWRETIKEFYSIVDLFYSDVVKLEDVKYSQSFLDSRKKAKNITYNSKGEAVRKKKREGEIICKIADNLERFVENKECKFVSHSIFLEKLHTYRHLTVYCAHEESDEIHKYYKITASTPRIKFMTFSSREIKKIEEESSNKLISLTEFMKGKTKHFQKIATAIYVKRFLNKYYSLRSKKDIFSEVNKQIYYDIIELEKYQNSFRISLDINIEDTILNICQNNYFIDANVEERVNRLQAVFSKMEYLPDLLESISYGYKKSQISRAFVDIFKYNKVRVNLEHYKTNFVEEQQQQEEIENV